MPDRFCCAMVEFNSVVMEKHTMPPSVAGRTSLKNGMLSRAFWCGMLLSAIAIFSVTSHRLGLLGDLSHYLPEDLDFKQSAKVVRHYSLTVGVRWLNLDGGRWRPMFVCNGQSPCPTLVAEEGDEISLNVVNDLGAQISIHWSGMGHRKFGFWNDGTGGLNQYPILPRGNYTSRFDTTGHWGLNWYADHTGAGVADGIYGTVYVAPSPSRPRPYSTITKTSSELRLIQEAERNIRHLTLWNSDFRTVDWKVNKLKGIGAVSDLYCYKSILVNGKGRVFCKDSNYNAIDGKALDDAGCVVQPGFSGHSCTPSAADFEVIETNGQEYIMMNLINVGFEHALKFSIDDHRFWVVATDAGFVEPQLVDTVHITNGARVTVLIKLDQEPQDYAMRLASASQMQNLVGYSVLRYPAKRYPLWGLPMELPKTDENTKICLNPDSSIPDKCKELDHSTVQPYPAQHPPKKVDKTLSWKAGSQKSEHLEHITEYFVNEKPWQLFRAAMKPVLFTDDISKVEKPIQNGLPLGTVVDLIVQNTLNETIPMYKHGDLTWLLGSKAHDDFHWDSVTEALKDGAAPLLNVNNPPMGVVHELPPLGWLAMRWNVNLKGATMFHAVKLRYFALGMAAPLLEGLDHSMVDEVPEYAKSEPHVVFEPKNSGIFG